MTAAAALVLDITAADEIDTVVETAIIRFLNGETHGQELFHALYDEPIDEPIPAHMLALVRSARLP